MPELPEVETVVRGLAPELPGRTIRWIEVLRPDLLRVPASVFEESLTGCLIRHVSRRGKNIVITGDDGRVLLVNLGMTGRLLLSSPATVVDSAAHLGVRFDLGGGYELLFDDVRRFGALESLDPAEWAKRELGLGIEPLSTELDADRLHALLSRSKAPIRSWLLDQRKLAGVGNIYANEALFRSGIHPRRTARSVNPADSRRLLDALRTVLTAAISAGGTTLRDYRGADGRPGEYRPMLRVYGRTAEPCFDCGSAIERTVIANRSAFHCPTCQPSGLEN